MRVRTDLHGTGALAFVAERVHVTNDREAELHVGGFEHRDGADVDHLMDGWGEGNLDPRHGSDARTPHATRDDHVVGIDSAVIGDDRLDDAILHDHVLDFDVGKGLQRTECLRAFAENRSCTQAVDHGHRRGVETSKQDIAVDERDHLFDLGRGHQSSRNPPVLCRHHSTAELFEALWSTRDLDATAFGVDTHFGVLALAVEVEHRHLTVVVNREDEVRGMASGAARVGERALVDLHDVAPAEFGQMANDGVADDAGADDNNSCRGREVAAHVGDPLEWDPNAGSDRNRWMERIRLAGSVGQQFVRFEMRHQPISSGISVLRRSTNSCSSSSMASSSAGAS